MYTEAHVHMHVHVYTCASQWIIQQHCVYTCTCIILAGVHVRIHVLCPLDAQIGRLACTCTYVCLCMCKDYTRSCTITTVLSILY